MLLKRSHHDVCCRWVEVAGWFVSEQYSRFAEKRSAQRDALCLAARYLPWFPARRHFNAKFLEQLHSSPYRSVPSYPSVESGFCDVVDHCAGLVQRRILENEPESVGADASSGRIRQTRDRCSIEEHLARAGAQHET